MFICCTDPTAEQWRKAGLVTVKHASLHDFRFYFFLHLRVRPEVDFVHSGILCVTYGDLLYFFHEVEFWSPCVPESDYWHLQR